jgi:hypothetical protein
VGSRASEHGAEIGLNELAIVGRRELPHPGVEDLDGLRARLDLREQKAPHDLGELGHELPPELGLSVHERLGLAEL